MECWKGEKKGEREEKEGSPRLRVEVRGYRVKGSGRARWRVITVRRHLGELFKTAIFTQSRPFRHELSALSFELLT